MLKRSDLPFGDDFFERFAGSSPAECWLWPGTRKSWRYGEVSSKRPGQPKRRWPAHRAAFAIARGDVPDGKCVLHRCDNPPCVNPAHLFLGTKLDNALDMVAKGRAHRVFGERNNGARLSDVSASALRAVARADVFTQSQLARWWGVSRLTARRITRGPDRASG